MAFDVQVSVFKLGRKFEHGQQESGLVFCRALGIVSLSSYF